MSETTVLWRSDPKYSGAVADRLWNKRKSSRRPYGIIYPTRTEHIVEALKVAEGKYGRVVVRSGGHNWAATSIQDDSVLIDLQNWKGISYDQSTGIVTATSATTGAELNEFLTPYGRMFAGGHCPSVSLGGFLLGGGVGWNARVRLAY
jgi:FAD/FMN-containing dehydrogenase